MMKTKTKAKRTTPAELVEAMMHCGAEFRFTAAGSLLVQNLAKLPAVLVDDFMCVEQKQFVAAVKAQGVMSCSASGAPRGF